MITGLCPETGSQLSLPRSPEAEAAARALLGGEPQPKMLGVLLTQEGPILKARSGLGPPGPDWVSDLDPVSPGDQGVVLQLQAIARELAGLPDLSSLESDWEIRWQALQQVQQEQRRERQRLRTCDNAEQMDDLSRRAKSLARRFKAQRQQALEPWRAIQQRRLELLRLRRELSRALQADMHRRLRLFPCQPWALAPLFDGRRPPGGTGDCCAPKLLHAALIAGLTPLALAEIWAGVPGEGAEFRQPCLQRCQPLLGPLLASRPQWLRLRLLYQDGEILALDKPSGCLSVAGREDWNADCLELRVKELFPDFRAVHRLDLETSGVLLLARWGPSLSHLQQQFAARRVVKCYLAQLSDRPQRESGMISLALGRDPARPGCYRPDPAGKPALTRFRRLQGTWVEFYPQSGRSHQLRIHAAAGLGCPIVGDRLYGGSPGGRLMLHAARLEFEHPQSGQWQQLASAWPT